MNVNFHDSKDMHEACEMKSSLKIRNLQYLVSCTYLLLQRRKARLCWYMEKVSGMDRLLEKRHLVSSNGCWMFY